MNKLEEQIRAAIVDNFDSIAGKSVDDITEAAASVSLRWIGKALEAGVLRAEGKFLKPKEFNEFIYGWIEKEGLSASEPLKEENKD